MNRIKNVSDIKFQGNKELIEIIGDKMDADFLDAIKGLSLSPEINKKYHDLKIVYTPIHGTGVKLVPASLRNYGFDNIIHVPEQDIPSGDFPTVASPNPENPPAMAMAIAKAKEVGADLVMASDPDADRIGVVVREPNGEYALINGNQIVMILLYCDDAQCRTRAPYRQGVYREDHRHHRDNQAHRRCKQHQDVRLLHRFQMDCIRNPRQ